MAVVLAEQKEDDTIHVMDMKDGDVGVIVAWEPMGYCGRIVQRHSTYLFTLGMPSVNGWGQVFDSDDSMPANCRVRILPPGTLLRIE